MRKIWNTMLKGLVAILPIGAFRPRWFMRRAHISPEEAVQAHVELAAQTSLAVHFGTFKLGDDGQQEPVARLHQALAAAGIGVDRFWVLGFGQGRTLPPAAPSTSRDK